MKLFKRNKPQPTPSKYIEVAGFKFRVLDPVSMPMVRRAELFGATYEREWGITKADLLLFKSAMEKQCQFSPAASMSVLNVDMANKFGTQTALLQQFEAVVTGDYQIKPFLKSACIVILMDGEDEYKIESNWTKKKLELCRDFPEVEAFFLDIIYVLSRTMESTPDSQKTLDLSVMAAKKRTESAFLSAIGSSLYEIGEP